MSTRGSVTMGSIRSVTCPSVAAKRLDQVLLALIDWDHELFVFLYTLICVRG